MDQYDPKQLQWMDAVRYLYPRIDFEGTRLIGLDGSRSVVHAIETPDHDQAMDFRDANPDRLPHGTDSMCGIRNLSGTYFPTPISSNAADTVSFIHGTEPWNTSMMQMNFEGTNPRIDIPSQQSPNQPNTCSSDAGKGQVYRCWDHGCEGRTFSSRSNYSRHIKEKSQQRPVASLASCQYCGRVFTRASGKRLHVESFACRRNR